MIAPTLITPPAALLWLPEVKTHLRVDHDDEDALIGGFMAAAEGWLDGWQGVLGRCIRTQTWAIRVAGLTDTCLPFPDVQSAEVTYLDAAGATQTVAGSNFRVRTINGEGWLTFSDGYAAPAVLAGRDDAVTITAVFGKAEAPPALKTAALMLVAHWYANREAVVTGTIATQVPMMVDTLIAPFRVRVV